jgi:SAM-dependent methyltransferase
MATYHPVLGAALPELGWVPAPSYLMRRDRILRMMRALPPGQLVEIGCGAGALLNDLARMGHACQAMETSPAARALAEVMLRDRSGIQVHATPPADWNGRFDYVLAFEVLEHIEDDRAALATWASWLKPRGHLVISVPAHQRRWTASDVWAGHYRRYEQAQLTGLLEASGFQIRQVECYGFPLSNMMAPVRGWLHQRAMRREHTSAEDKAGNTQRSGTERAVESRFYPLEASFVGTALLKLNFALQALSVRTEMGTGFLVLAQKS